MRKIMTIFILILLVDCNKEGKPDIENKNKETEKEEVLTSVKSNLFKEEKPINIKFSADVLSATPQVVKKRKFFFNKSHISAYTYTIVCDLDNQGKVINEEDLTIGTILYVGGKPKQKKETIVKLKNLYIENINDLRPAPIQFPIGESDGYRVFLYLPNVPKSDHRVTLRVTLRHKASKKPIYSKLLTLPSPGEADNISFLTKASDKKWWWLTSILGLTSLSLAAVALGIALA